MEIINRKPHGDEGEMVPWNASKKAVHKEVLRRNANAGYCERDGSLKSAGKGDRYRPVNKKKYDENYEKIIFGKK